VLRNGSMGFFILVIPYTKDIKERKMAWEGISSRYYVLLLPVGWIAFCDTDQELNPATRRQTTDIFLWMAQISEGWVPELKWKMHIYVSFSPPKKTQLNQHFTSSSVIIFLTKIFFQTQFWMPSSFVSVPLTACMPMAFCHCVRPSVA
jgi:hypothetical protein